MVYLAGVGADMQRFENVFDSKLRSGSFVMVFMFSLKEATATKMLGGKGKGTGALSKY